MSLPTGLNEHFTGSGKHKKAKKSFDSLADAQNFIIRNGIKGKQAYKCGFCGKYHIGHV